jgi:riboflavin kinase / FMN adenylyltransferase
MDNNIELTGKVVHGFERGRKIGFPTANLELTSPNDSLPKHGVYASKVLVGNKTYIALTNIGLAKTFGATTPTVEPHILDFDSDIYGKTLTVILFQHLRDMIKFPSVNELIGQLTKDCLQIREFFNGKGFK